MEKTKISIKSIFSKIIYTSFRRSFDWILKPCSVVFFM
jgi:hypothetical protein